MARKRRQFSGEFKARVALEALKEDRSLAELASKHEVHPNQITRWKREVRKGLSGIFSSPAQDNSEQEELIARLYEKIGRLEVELDWLKKKSGQLE